MTSLPSLSPRVKAVAALAASVLTAVALTGAGGVATAAPTSGDGAPSAAAFCFPGQVSGPALGSGARAADGASAKEPKLHPDNQANAYGALPDRPLLPAGSVNVRTVFHVISDAPLSAAERTRMQTMVDDQMDVLNAAYSGDTSATAADTPFRFDLDETNYVVNPAWYTVVPGKNERDMKKALYEGDSTVLNVYAANIGGGLLGWAYFPKGYNNGRDYIDGVVILDESMPGGVNPDDPSEEWKYGLGDTLVHEVGHWLMLHHTFNTGCSAAGDFVEDTPKEAVPQFDCPVGADTCKAPGLDPIRNFMDYTQDSCMNEFTPGQAERMSDAWLAFRAGGRG